MKKTFYGQQTPAYMVITVPSFSTISYFFNIDTSQMKFFVTVSQTIYLIYFSFIPNRKDRDFYHIFFHRNMLVKKFFGIITNYFKESIC